MDEEERRRRLEALFRDHADAVHAYALRRSNATSADDVVSEVFAVACRRLEDIPETALPWLLACARRALANQRRGLRRLGRLRSRLAMSPPLQLPVDEGDQTLRLALNKLSERDREILLLTAWEGLGPEEVCDHAWLLPRHGGGTASSSTQATRGRTRVRRQQGPGDANDRGVAMTDLLDRLRAENPVPKGSPPAFEDVWARIDRHRAHVRPRRRWPGPTTLGWGVLAVLPAALVAFGAIMLLGHRSSPAGSSSSTTSLPRTERRLMAVEAEQMAQRLRALRSGLESLAAGQIVAQVNLASPNHRRPPIGIAEILRKGDRYGLSIAADGLAPNSAHTLYAVWLSGAKRTELLGFIWPKVGRTGRAKAAGGLPTGASAFRFLLITLEHTATPHHPGLVVLRGRLRI